MAWRKYRMDASRWPTMGPTASWYSPAPECLHFVFLLSHDRSPLPTEKTQAFASGDTVAPPVLIAALRRPSKFSLPAFRVDAAATGWREYAQRKHSLTGGAWICSTRLRRCGNYGVAVQ